MRNCDASQARRLDRGSSGSSRWISATISIAALIASTVACASAEPDVLPVTDSQLREYLGVIEAAAQDAGPESIVRRSVQREEAIADCMAQLGFDYVPTPTTAESQGIADADFYWGMDTLEWVQENGYGISTNPVCTDLLTDPGSGARNPEAEAGTDSETDFGTIADADPNAEIFEGLSASEQEVYQRALHGDGYASADEEPDEFEYIEADGHGCMTEAEASLPMDPADLLMNEEVAEIYAAITAMTEQVEEDPEVRAVIREWSACMTQRGHVDFGRPSEIVTYLEERLAVLVGARIDTEDGSEPDGDESEQPRARRGDSGSLSELTREEVALAVADLQCADSTGLDEARSMAQVRLENQYVQQHRDDLERIRLAVADYSQ